jgi:hypothetical protein
MSRVARRLLCYNESGTAVRQQDEDNVDGIYMSERSKEM